jgi:hypothetical protein
MGRNGLVAAGIHPAIRPFGRSRKRPNDGLMLTTIRRSRPSLLASILGLVALGLAICPCPQMTIAAASAFSHDCCPAQRGIRDAQVDCCDRSTGVMSVATPPVPVGMAIPDPWTASLAVARLTLALPSVLITAPCPPLILRI